MRADGDRVVSDVDVTAREAVGGGDVLDLCGGVDRRRPRREQNLAGANREIQNFGYDGVVGEVDGTQR